MAQVAPPGTTVAPGQHGRPDPQVAPGPAGGGRAHGLGDRRARSTGCGCSTPASTRPSRGPSSCRSKRRARPTSAGSAASGPTSTASSPRWRRCARPSTKPTAPLARHVSEGGRRLLRDNLGVAAGTGLSRVTGVARLAALYVAAGPGAARRLRPGQQHAEHHLRADPRRHPHGHPGAAVHRAARARRRRGHVGGRVGGDHRPRRPDPARRWSSLRS